MRELYAGIFMQEIDLPGNPLKSINNYIVKGDGGDLMIDTAFNRPECIEQLESHLLQCAVDPAKLRLFLTHLHADHTGLAGYLTDRGAQVLMGETDLAIVSDSCIPDHNHWAEIQRNAHAQGLDEDDVHIEEHPGFRWRPAHPIQATALHEGDVISVGPYRFEVVDLAGHTPGMQGLYEPVHQLFFCGDHILGKITPNITYWNASVGDSLGRYFENLEKVRKLPIRHLFSSHRFLVEDVPARIDELFHHHEVRLQEAVACLEKYGPSTVRTVTKNLHWDIRAKNWDDFPKSQKWFAAGEAMAHLEHLVAIGRVARYTRADGVFEYALVK
ncbi:MAG: MBL fold metallo-hydrolase [Ndongobacter sp.]|nr:MBL fold metallo-hydrolase [Ndongobacter sp.]